MTRGTHNVGTSNGEGSMTIRIPEDPNLPTEGNIKPDRLHDYIRNIELLPFTWSFRGMDTSYTRYNYKEMKAGGRSTVRGINLIEYSVPANEGRTTTFFSTRAREYVVVRARLNRSPFLNFQYDIDYRLHECGRWLVSGWKLTESTPAGKLTREKRFGSIFR